MTYTHSPSKRVSYAFNGFYKQGIKQTVKNFEKICNLVKFNSIAYTGTSGGLIAPILAYEYDKELLLVRKPKDSQHAAHEVEGEYNTHSYLIVDDTICSGSTISRIRTQIDRNLYLYQKPRFMGVYLYQVNTECWDKKDYNIYYFDEKNKLKIYAGEE